MLASVLGLASPEEVFPWQEDLLACFQRPEIPSALDIPTGLGKTSVMAIWVVARIDADGIEFLYSSLLERDGEQVRVLARARGQW